MKPVSDYDKIMSGLERFFVTERFEYLHEIVFADGLEKMIIFPADDVFLTNEQFEAVISILIEDEKLYFLNFGYDKNVRESMNEICELEEHSYEEYYSAREFIPIMPLTMLFSDSFRWVVVIDEDIQSGTAVFAADKEIMDTFKGKYVNWREDVPAYEDFCRKYNYEERIKIF